MRKIHSLIILLAFVGCGGEFSLQKIKLPSGEIVECFGVSPRKCGEHLYDCTNNKEYICQNNLEIISRKNEKPWEILKPSTKEAV